MSIRTGTGKPFFTAPEDLGRTRSNIVLRRLMKCNRSAEETDAICLLIPLETYTFRKKLKIISINRKDACEDYVFTLLIKLPFYPLKYKLR
jgi:hypothetical protein